MVSSRRKPGELQSWRQVIKKLSFEGEARGDMNKAIKRFFATASLMPLAVMLPINLTATPTPTPFRSSEFSDAYGLENNGNTLDIAAGTEYDYQVDVSGLDVNLACVKNNYVTVKSARVDILRLGCAKIIGSPRNSAEESAQAYAQANHLGVWAPVSSASATPSSSAPSTVSPTPGTSVRRGPWFGAVFHWLGAHISLVLAILSCPVIIWLVRRFSIFLHKRKVNIIIVGVVAAGKTVLWTRWRELYDPSPQPSFSRVEARIEPVELRKWTLLPTVIDTPGTQPEHLLSEVLRTRGISRAVRSRTKHVLVQVLSPCRDDAPRKGADFAVPDTHYVAEQLGYTESLPLALARQQDPRIKLDMVIMFVTKFDLFSDANPKDSPRAALNDIELMFKKHQKIMRDACKGSDIPFTWIIGSSKKEWGIEDLKKSINRIIQ
jgi:hypothetical protein